GDVGAGTNVLMKQRPKIHPVKLIATQDEVIVERPLEKVPHVLADGVSGTLIPLRAFGSLLGRENVHETAREIVELIARLDVPMQRHAVELRQDKNRPQT